MILSMLKLLGALLLGTIAYIFYGMWRAICKGTIGKMNAGRTRGKSQPKSQPSGVMRGGRVHELVYCSVCDTYVESCEHIK